LAVTGLDALGAGLGDAILADADLGGDSMRESGLDFAATLDVACDFAAVFALARGFGAGATGAGIGAFAAALDVARTAVRVAGILLTACPRGYVRS